MSTYPQEASNLAPGYRLERYELLCPIGMGGMASVWVARLLGKHGFEKLVAIKTILPHIARDPRFQQMFLDEARIASRIHHANVAQILDLGDQQGVLFLAMEWIEGDGLSKLAQAVRQRGEVFPAGIALKIVADVCAGLHAAHELCDRSGAPLGIVHRDVSPQNILISEQGVVKVIDFGIAKARDRVGVDTETGSFRGKVKYMAPEQALSPRTIDRRADLWSVGAILYFLVSGQAPYDRENDFATLTQLALGKPPTSLPDSVPEPVRAVITRALAWEPAERYATAAEFQAALEQAMVEIGSAATTADIAAFCERHLSDRSARRKSGVTLALSAAEERARVSTLLEPQGNSTASFDFRSQAGPPSGGEARTPLTGSQPRTPVSETSTTLADAATPTTSPALTRPRSHWAITAALMSLVTVAAVFVVFSMGHRGGNAASAKVGLAAPSESVARPAPVVPSVVAAAAPAATPAASDTGAPVEAKPTRPMPAAVRRRPPVTQRSSSSNPGTDPSVAPGLKKERADYGF